MKFNGLIKQIQKLPTVARVGVYVLIFIIFRFLLDALLNSLRTLKIMKEGMDNKEKFILFHWKNCGHCKRMMPEWDKFTTKYEGNISVKKIEKDENPSLIEKLGIKGYPTIMLLNGDDSKKETYSGERTSEAFMKFLSNK